MRGHEEAAWVALVDGGVVGNVGVGRVEGELADAFVAAAARPARLALVSVLFVSPETRGPGSGRGCSTPPWPGRGTETGSPSWTWSRATVPPSPSIGARAGKRSVAARTSWLPDAEEPLLLMSLPER